MASDRISAYDSVLPDAIPFKGEILTRLSLFWFQKLNKICKTHFISALTGDFPELGLEKSYLNGRSMLVQKASVVPIECIVRGYLAGSAWQEYRSGGTIAGQAVKAGLRESEVLPEPLFTPSTKAESGHDENISIERMADIVGGDLTGRLKTLSLTIYKAAADYAGGRGIIVADTKFEFGMVGDEIILIDEVLTPDSSRFWHGDEYRVGSGQASFDKQFVRDYLDDIGWDRQPPAPALPAKIIEMTSAKYVEAYQRLTGERFISKEND